MEVMDRGPIAINYNAQPIRVAKILAKYKSKPTFPVVDNQGKHIWNDVVEVPVCGGFARA